MKLKSQNGLYKISCYNCGNYQRVRNLIMQLPAVYCFCFFLHFLQVILQLPLSYICHYPVCFLKNISHLFDFPLELLP